MKKFLAAIVALFILSITWQLRALWISSFSLSTQRSIDPATISGKITSESVAFFNNRVLSIPPFPQQSLKDQAVLGLSDSNKRIEIDLTNQRLYAYEGDRRVYNFLISSGKWGRTPTGRFKIWVKLRATKMEGGSKALRTYYYLPNVPYVMYFYNSQIPKWRGYGLHGTYWHDNFGHPMSHGCINMKTEEVQQLYYWANPDLQGKSSIYASAENPGTEIIIYGDAPWE